MLAGIQRIGHDTARPRISRTIDETSYILMDDVFTKEVLKRRLPVQRREVKLGGGKGGLLGALEALGISRGSYLLVIDLGKDAVARLIVHNGVVTAACVTYSGREVCGREAVDIIDSMLSGDIKVAVTRLPEQLYVWSPELSVFIKGIDLQHKQLVRMVNNLYYSFLIGKPRSVLLGMLNFLDEYSRFHFSSEEKIFDKYGYPKAKQHKREHQHFIDRVNEYISVYRRGEDRSLASRMLTYLAKWVRTHIMVSDKDYGRWLKQQGYI